MEKINKKSSNGDALTEKFKVITELNLVVIEKLGQDNINANSIENLKRQSKILMDYQEKAMNRDRWNRFFRVLQILIYLSTILFFGILVVMILGAAGDLIILDGTIHDLLIGILSSLTGLLSVLFLSILTYLGLKKET